MLWILRGSYEVCGLDSCERFRNFDGNGPNIVGWNLHWDLVGSVECLFLHALVPYLQARITKIQGTGVHRVDLFDTDISNCLYEDLKLPHFSSLQTHDSPLLSVLRGKLNKRGNFFSHPRSLACADCVIANTLGSLIMKKHSICNKIPGFNRCLPSPREPIICSN